jgi:hypothetical protein
MYLVCTRYVLVHTGTYLEKQKTNEQNFQIQIVDLMHSILHTLYHYATSVHSEPLVISMVDTWYLPPETYTRVARYLLTGVGRRARVQPRPLLWP